MKALLPIFCLLSVVVFPREGYSQNIQATSFSGNRLAATLTAEASNTNLLPLATGTSEHLIPGSFPISLPSESLPKVFAPSQPRTVYTRFPWKRNIITTVFWVGETPTANNPTPNTVSAWDRKWTSNFGGFDDPKASAREGFLPKKFTPGQNPFYFALPYNDISRQGTKATARAMVPWFDKAFNQNGHTVLKGRWIAVRKGDQICYAQWEDVGPFETDDCDYVFGEKRPKTSGNGGAGLDVSPAVRDFLGFPSGHDLVDWRFVDIDEVPDGPWRQYGSNNPFANSTLTENGTGTGSESILEVSENRDRLMVSRDPSADETATDEER